MVTFMETLHLETCKIVSLIFFKSLLYIFILFNYNVFFHIIFVFNLVLVNYNNLGSDEES